MLFREELKLPLGMDQLKKILEQRSSVELMEAEIPDKPMGIVSYQNSGLKDDQFINYVANLKLCVELKTDEEIPSEEKIGLLEAYLKSHNMSSITTLNEALGIIILEEKGLPNEDESKIWLNPDERKTFSENNKEELGKWIKFMDSLVYSLPMSVEQYAETIGKELIDEGHLEVIDDNRAVGANIGFLAITPGFLEHYFSLPIKTKPALYEVQMFDPIFSGYSMISLLSSRDSLLYQFMVGLFEGWFEKDKVKELLQT